MKVFVTPIGSVARRFVSAVRERRLVSGLRRRVTVVAIAGPRRGYLRRCRGVIHVGANNGGERHEYAGHRLPVIWIEPIPEVFERLKENLREVPDQRAIRALVTDRDGASVTLHVSSNDGHSSSILELSMHRDIWPTVQFTHDITMLTTTLPTLLADQDLTKYDTLVIDTQGSELSILRGATPILHRFRHIECEAADFEAYRGCAKVSEIVDFLKTQGFWLVRRDVQARHPAGGTYFDLLFRRSRFDLLFRRSR